MSRKGLSLGNFSIEYLLNFELKRRVVVLAQGSL